MNTRISHSASSFQHKRIPETRFCSILMFIRSCRIRFWLLVVYLRPLSTSGLAATSHGFQLAEEADLGQTHTFAVHAPGRKPKRMYLVKVTEQSHMGYELWSKLPKKGCCRCYLGSSFFRATRLDTRISDHNSYELRPRFLTSPKDMDPTCNMEFNRAHNRVPI